MTTITDKSSVYTRWMDLSTRLINIMDVTDERREKITKEVRGFIELFEDEEIHEWDSIANYEFYGETDIGGIANNANHFGKYFVLFERDEFGGRFYNQICAATRAGLDVATGNCGGVIGYTIGDILEAFDGCIPDWVCAGMGISGDEDEDLGVWL